jgi:pimeloyl-ACP methyl ester carboxylesterase
MLDTVFDTVQNRIVSRPRFELERKAAAQPAGSILGYRQIGANSAKRTLVLVPGSFFNHHQWDKLLPSLQRALGRRVRIIMPDYRGVGLSASLIPHSSAENIREYIADVRRFVEHLQLEQMDLLGYSLGTAVALGLAAELGKGRVRSIIGYGMPYPTREDVKRVEQSFSKDDELHKLYWRGRPASERIDKTTVVKVLRTLTHVAPEDSRLLTRLKLRVGRLKIQRMLVGTRQDAIGNLLEHYAHATLFAGDSEQLAAAFPKLSGVDIKLLVGAQDTSCPFEHTKVVVEAIGGKATMQVIPQADHLALGLDSVVAEQVGMLAVRYLKQLDRQALEAKREPHALMPAMI